MGLTFAPNLLVLTPWNQGVHFKDLQKTFPMLLFGLRGGWR
jgi:hypothetical protein